MSDIGPALPISQEIHASKYRTEGETFRDAMNRIASALKDDNQHFQIFRDILMDMRFLPAGRVQASVGSGRSITAFNCFVSGTIEDSLTQDEGSIMQRAVEAAETMRQGGGIGYDFSGLRPRGDLIKKLGSHSSGPISFMGIFDAVCKCVSSAGQRRGAQMGVLRVDHPDIFDFIRAKQDQKSLTGFNISVGVTDEFMSCLETGEAFPLRFGGNIYREVDPNELWETLMRSTWDWAEPGVLFIDSINRMNNLYYCEVVAATNPCAEQSLPPYGACLLGSFNMVKYVVKDEKGRYSIDLKQFKEDIPPVIRAMDNIIDRTTYPIPAQGKEARAKRRMGIGITGVANAIEAAGFPYGTEAYIAIQDHIEETLRDYSYLTSIELAVEKGRFARFNKHRYCAGKFIKTLPESIQKDIFKNGIRNSHLTSIAPTGTISLCADNVSSGIEPVFSYSYDRTIIRDKGPTVETVEDYGRRVFGVSGKRAADVSIAEHLAVLTHAQKYVDSSVSKTCNVGDDIEWEEFKDIYIQAYKGGAKGCTTFRAAGKRAGILVSKDKDTEALACTYDPETGKKTCE